jgi:hypothetical protein
MFCEMHTYPFTAQLQGTHLWVNLPTNAKALSSMFSVILTFPPWDRLSSEECERKQLQLCASIQNEKNAFSYSNSWGEMTLPTLFRARPVQRPESGKQLHFWGVHSNRDLFSRHFQGNSKIF